MSKVNWGRLLIGALVAAIICFLSDGFFHEKVVAADWTAVYDGIRAVSPEVHGTGLAYFALFEIGRGFLAVFLYVMMRPHYGAGPKTAVMAALVTWFAVSITTPAQFIPLGFYSNALLVKVGIYQLIITIIATIAGAAIYRDAAKTTS
jgi:hypothetical protein